jgi:chlorophyllide a reductase subunit Y
MSQGDGYRDGGETSASLIPICSLCVSDTVGLPFELLPKQIGNTEIVRAATGVFVHTHARAKDIVVDSLVWRLPSQRKARAGVNLIGEVFPSDPIKIDDVLRRIGTHVNTTVPGPRWADYVAMVDGVNRRCIRSIARASSG